tara:strand:+ start:1065 stop:2228 length:1164 start_codon:yes stop_codon:yes gene_type:complete
MPIINQIADYYEEMKEWRRHLHANPELGFECYNTSGFVIQKLKEFGIDKIYTGIAKTGLVAIINGKKKGKTIGLRADMDALPLKEEIDHNYKSKVDGVMHACGHDGHTTMLLGAAKYLVDTKNFAGQVALIFQPAEEKGGGAAEMCKEGIMDKFSIDEVYGIHTLPGSPLGKFETNSNTVFAASDDFLINITGNGGHGAYPEQTVDPVMIATQITQGIQSITARNINALKPVVISVTQIHTGTAYNIIPETASINGTVRTLTEETQELVKQRMTEICNGYSLAFKGKIELIYNYGYPATINYEKEAAFAIEVAEEISGKKNVDGNAKPDMGAEDFSFMLHERPGAFLNLGQGNGPGVHNTKFDFNDDLSPIGASFFVKLIEKGLPLN